MKRTITIPQPARRVEIDDALGLGLDESLHFYQSDKVEQDTDDDGNPTGPERRVKAGLRVRLTVGGVTVEGEVADLVPGAVNASGHLTGADIINQIRDALVDKLTAA